MFTMPFGMMKSTGDPFWDNVSLLLTGDGPDGSTTILDSSPNPKTVTAVGDAQISTAQSKFGGSSLAFNKTQNTYIEAVQSSANQFVFDGEFTIEGWFYLNNYNAGSIAYKSNIIHGSTSSVTVYALIGAGGASNVPIWDIFGQGSRSISGTTTPALNQWHHIAVSRDSSSNIRLYLNGNLEGSVVDAGTIGNTNGTVDRLNLGHQGAISTQLERYLDGYLDDIRITKGVARYTANFTPPTAAFPIG